jgi:Ca-activated chloride channel family protein
MRFARPEMLWLLALVPALGAWLVWGWLRRRRALQAFAEPALLERLVQGPGRGLLAAKGALMVAAVALFVLASARPQWGATTEQVTRQGVDVLIGIDISESMLSEDIAPSRLRKSQEEVSRLLEKLRGDRVGLMAFAGSAGVLCPLTLDYNAVRIFLDELSPSLISHPGTSLAMALEVGSQAFGSQQRQHKVMILFSDGEDQIDAAEVEARAQEAASQGLVVHAVGVGTPSGGPIPERGRDGSITGYKKDSEGRVVTSRLDEKLLARVTEITGGSYQPATAAEEELDRLAEAIAGMDKKEMSARLTTQYEERYQVPLALGLLALVVDTFLTGRRRIRAGSPLVALAAVWLLSGVPAVAASVASLVEEGNRLYREGRLAEALQAYQQAERLEPANPAVQYNIGNVLYKQQEFDAAFERYRKAFPDPRRPLSQGAHYNAGNTHFARRNWPEAIRHYKEALQIDPADMEAKKNLELALRAMEEEKKQQQQQQDQEQDDQDQNQDQNQQQKPERPQDQREQDAPRPQPREQRSPQQDSQQKISRQEAMRILDAMKELDRPPKDPLKTPPPDKRPEKDW